MLLEISIIRTFIALFYVFLYLPIIYRFPVPALWSVFVDVIVVYL